METEGFVSVKQDLPLEFSLIVIRFSKLAFHGLVIFPGSNFKQVEKLT